MKVATFFGIMMVMVALGRTAPLLNDRHDVVKYGDYKWSKERSVDPELESLIISAISTGVHVGMVSIGADEKTETKIRNAFHLPRADDVIIRDILKKYTLKMDEQKTHNILIRNKIFTKDGYAFPEAIDNSSIESKNDATVTTPQLDSSTDMFRQLIGGEKWEAYIISALNWIEKTMGWKS